MEILRGNPGEAEEEAAYPGGWCHFYLISGSFFAKLYFLYVGGVRKKVLRFRVSWTEGSLTPCRRNTAQFPPSICTKGVFLQVPATWLGRKQMNKLSSACASWPSATSHSPFLPLCVLHATAPSRSSAPASLNPEHRFTLREHMARNTCPAYLGMRFTSVIPLASFR